MENKIFQFANINTFLETSEKYLYIVLILLILMHYSLSRSNLT